MDFDSNKIANLVITARFSGPCQSLADRSRPERDGGDLRIVVTRVDSRHVRVCFPICQDTPLELNYF